MTTIELIEIASSVDLIKADLILRRIQLGELKLSTIQQKKSRLQVTDKETLAEYLMLDLVVKLTKFDIKQNNLK